MEFGDIKKLLADLFNVDADTFFEAIKLSPNAQGYLIGAISEFTLLRDLENRGYEVLRIKEKWEGDKHPNHHGDFYIRKKGTKEWFVLESKGIKSNSEKWHKLFNKSNLIKFLKKNISKTPFRSEKEIENYIGKNLPLFEEAYKTDMYTINDINKYKPSKKETQKSEAIASLKKLKPKQIENLIHERLKYVMEHMRLIETHLVSGGSKKSLRTQATPRIDEFHVLSLNLFLRTGNHEFIFVNPLDLEPSASDRNHLQQNYLLDVIVTGIRNRPNINPPWTTDFDKVFSSLKNPAKEEDMQIDERILGG